MQNQMEKGMLVGCLKKDPPSLPRVVNATKRHSRYQCSERKEEKSISKSDNCNNHRPSGSRRLDGADDEDLISVHESIEVQRQDAFFLVAFGRTGIPGHT